MKKFEIDPAKVLSVTVTVLGIAGTILSNKVDGNNRKKMKAEIKEELVKELSEQVKGS
jgi:hypothetical protein